MKFAQNRDLYVSASEFSSTRSEEIFKLLVMIS